jgi:hypothetical protein
MIPPRSFPPGTLTLAEMDGKKIVTVHAKLTTSTGNRLRAQSMMNDLLMLRPELNLQILENHG